MGSIINIIYSSVPTKAPSILTPHSALLVAGSEYMSRQVAYPYGCLFLLKAVFKWLR